MSRTWERGRTCARSTAQHAPRMQRAQMRRRPRGGTRVGHQDVQPAGRDLLGGALDGALHGLAVAHVALELQLRRECGNKGSVINSDFCLCFHSARPPPPPTHPPTPPHHHPPPHTPPHHHHHHPTPHSPPHPKMVMMFDAQTVGLLVTSITARRRCPQPAGRRAPPAPAPPHRLAPHVPDVLRHFGQLLLVAKVCEGGEWRGSGGWGVGVGVGWGGGWGVGWGGGVGRGGLDQNHFVV